MEPKLSRQQTREIARVMGVTEEMIPLFPLLRSRTQVMNPWVRSLPGIFRGIHLQRGLRVLDLPCGEGGVSVPLARNYGVRVKGYDLLPHFVSRANSLAKKSGVQGLCRYEVGDVRDVLRRRAVYDLLLWFSGPEVFDSPESTIRTLRGSVIIGDGYLKADKGTTDLGRYDTLKNTTRAYSAFGDRVKRVMDYGGRLWREDYRRERTEIEHALRTMTNRRYRAILEGHLRWLREDEVAVTRDLGLAIWMVTIKKRGRSSGVPGGPERKPAKSPGPH